MKERKQKITCSHCKRTSYYPYNGVANYCIGCGKRTNFLVKLCNHIGHFYYHIRNKIYHR